MNPETPRTFDDLALEPFAGTSFLDIQLALQLKALIRRSPGPICLAATLFERSGSEPQSAIALLKALSKQTTHPLECIYDVRHEGCNEEWESPNAMGNCLLVHQQYLVKCGLNSDTLGNITSISASVIGVNPLDSFLPSVTELFQKLGYSVSTGAKKDKSTQVTFVTTSSRGSISKSKLFPELSFTTIEENYTQKVVDQVRGLIAKAKAEKDLSGLAMIHGPVGVGKTYLIRALLSELQHRRGVICSPSLDFLRHLGLLNDALNAVDQPILIFEDIGEIIAADASANHPEAFSNLLNLSDGLQSILASAIIVLTFNYDVGKINPALLRPGRCLANIQVGKLPQAQAQKLVGKPLQNREYSLAEVYAIKNGTMSADQAPEALVGFRPKV